MGKKMKKVLYILIFIFLGVFLFDFLFLKYLFVSKEIENKVNFEIDNSCSSDQDCQLLEVDFSCEYRCSSCEIKDLSKDNYVSLNAKNYTAKKNCPPFKAEDMLMCPQCVGKYVNEYYVAACRHNVCVKVRKSVLERCRTKKELKNNF